MVCDIKQVVIAIDSFKGSLSSAEAGNTVAEAAQQVFPNADVRIYPLADGGEGTLEALVPAMQGQIVSVEVTGPLGGKVQGRYGRIGDRAIIEMADAAGLNLVPEEKRNPLHTTTYGVGETILAAAKAGCRHFLIGIGGSATNDCGLGMLQALGMEFLDTEGRPVGCCGSDLANIASIRRDHLSPLLRDCDFQVACDVKNPLYGPVGCSAVYGPQKGATPEIVAQMDASIKRFAALAEVQFGVSGAEAPGAGAAGGLGFAFAAFLGAELKPGVELVLETLRIVEALQGADIFITGEGRLDGQSVQGKAPIGAAKLAKKVQPGIAVLAFCGCALSEAEMVNKHGIDAYFPILQTPCDERKAMEADTAKSNLRSTALQALRLVKAAKI